MSTPFLSRIHLWQLLLILSGVLLLFLPLHAEVPETEEKEPPPVGLALGHIPPADGVTGSLPDGTGFHFRIEENRLFLFLLDDEGLIRAPDIFTATLSLVGNMNPGDRSTTQFYTTFPAPGRPALTSSRLIFPPHVFSATLFIFMKNTPEPTFQTQFRYSISADPSASASR